MYDVHMQLHSEDRYIACLDKGTAPVHVDVGYVIDENWLAVGHYYPGEAGLLLCELTVFPLSAALRRAATVTFDDDTRSPSEALGPATMPLIYNDQAAWTWARNVGALPRRPQEIYARLVRRIPFADMAVAAEVARKGFVAQREMMQDTDRDGLGRLTDAARWNEEIDLYEPLDTGESITEARKTYLRAAILFEQLRDANQVRYSIARAMGMDVSNMAKKKHSESKVRALLDGARRHRYLLAAGVSGRTAGGLTPIGRDLAAKHFPELLEGVVS